MNWVKADCYFAHVLISLLVRSLQTLYETVLTSFAHVYLSSYTHACVWLAMEAPALTLLFQSKLSSVQSNALRLLYPMNTSINTIKCQIRILNVMRIGKKSRGLTSRVRGVMEIVLCKVYGTVELSETFSLGHQFCENGFLTLLIKPKSLWACLRKEKLILFVRIISNNNKYIRIRVFRIFNLSWKIFFI